MLEFLGDCYVYVWSIQRATKSGVGLDLLRCSRLDLTNYCLMKTGLALTTMAEHLKLSPVEYISLGGAVVKARASTRMGPCHRRIILMREK